MNSKKIFTPVVIGLAWLVSLGAVFLLGILLTFAIHLEPDPEKADAALQIEDRELKLTFERLLNREINMSEVKSTDPDHQFPNILRDALIQVGLWKDEVERRYHTHVLSRSLSLRKVMASIQFLGEQSISTGNTDVLQSFVKRWAMEDGRSALAYSLNLQNEYRRNLSIRAVLQGWSSVKSEEAWKWIESQRYPMSTKLVFYDEIVYYLSNRSPEFVLNQLSTFPDDEGVIELYLTYFQRRLEVLPVRSLLGDLNWVQDSARPLVVLILGERWAGEEPEVALNWMLSNGLSFLDIEGALDLYVSTFPEEAMQWAIENAPPDDLSLVLERLAIIWIGNSGPAPLADWINRQEPNSMLDGATRQLALMTADYDPIAGLEWARSITDEASRRLTIIDIAEDWLEVDPQTAWTSLNEFFPDGSAGEYLFGTADAETLSEETILPSDN